MFPACTQETHQSSGKRLDIDWPVIVSKNPQLTARLGGPIAIQVQHQGNFPPGLAARLIHMARIARIGRIRGVVQFQLE
jgi:hypothetical protein